LQNNDQVIGVDNLNDYYEVQLKRDRLEQLEKSSSFIFHQESLENREAIQAVFERHQPELVVNLAAQAGVRYSLTNPYAYIDSNIAGFMNILEACRHNNVKHLIYASSSSVYGSNTEMPFSVHQNVDHPLSLYAATKKSNELMAHAYSHLFQVPTTGLRFFTVYGPWGRPDMAVLLFTRAILENRPIDIFNHGKMQRDLTYIDDIVKGVILVSDHIPQPNPGWSPIPADPASSTAPYQIFNIGNNQPVELMKLIELLERFLGKTAQKR